jgi:S-adenosylmethionine hydrolase
MPAHAVDNAVEYFTALLLKMLLTLIVLALTVSTAWSADPLVLQSDFGVKDGAVASMKGVAVSVSAELDIYDLTHEVPAFNIWEASLRLAQTAEYWPKGTVFVSVVDPGVGTERKSVVLKTRSGHYFVSPDNGSLTAVAEQLGVDAVREIDEAVNRLANSEQSYTFHGRDVYAYTGARLAAGVISFEEVGRELPPRVVSIAYQKPRFEQGRVYGNIEILDPQYGNVWTNIDRTSFQQLALEPGDEVTITITDAGVTVLQQTLPYHATFGGVAVGEPLLYLNILNNVALGINQGNYADSYAIGSGASWNIEIAPSK